MNKLKKFAASPAVTLAALALALCLLAFSTVGGTRAALTYYSENYVSTVQMQELGVTLVENGKAVATGNAAIAARDGIDRAASAGALFSEPVLQGSTVPEPAGEPLKPGAVYTEELWVHNPTDNGADAADGAANITQYVRVTVSRYWIRPVTGLGWVKAQDLDPALIDLHFVTDGGWIEDESARTAERTVLYYTRPLAPGAVTPVFADTLRIDPSVTVTVDESAGADGSITRTYIYDNAAFQFEVKVDAVQNHNAADAIRSAWGREVTVGADGTLQLS